MHLLTVITCSALAGIACGQPQIVELGTLPDSVYLVPEAISADGQTVVGWSRVASTGRGQAFRWSQATGVQALAMPAGTLSSAAYAVNADGTVVVGGTSLGAFRWTLATGTEILPTNGVWPQDATAVSSDGTIIGGTGDLAGHGQAFRWTAGSGTIALGNLPTDDTSRVYAMSGDGAVMTGWARYSGQQQRAYRWSAHTESQVLPLLTGGIHSAARAITRDGSMIAGGVNFPDGTAHSVLWHERFGSIDLITTPAWAVFGAWGMSGDGTTLVGTYNAASPPMNQPEGFVWRASTGPVNVNEWLPVLGINPSEWFVYGVSAVSHDGTVIAGIASHSNQSGVYVLRGLPRDCVSVWEGPKSTTVCTGRQVAFRAVVGGDGPLQYQWTRDGVPLANDARVHGTTDAVLVIDSVWGSDAGQYRCTISNLCGNSDTASATLAVCPADFDDDGDFSNGHVCGDGVDVNDLLCFVAAFEAGDIAADLDDGNAVGVPDAGVDVNDLLYFLGRFELGC